MVVRTFIKLKRSTRSLSSGFTLVELTVTLLLASAVMGLALKVIVDQRRLFLEDQTRTQADQNLRAAMDLVGTDIKQTGERLESDTELPGISVINGGTVSGVEQPDQLVLQRKLIPDVLRVCEQVGGGGTEREIDVSVETPPSLSPATITTSCPFSNGGPGDPDPTMENTLEQFRNHRWSQDGNPNASRTVALNPPATSCQQAGGTDRECVWAYIHDPATDRGEFFLYAFEDSSTCQAFRIVAIPPFPENRTCYRIHAYPNPSDPDSAKRGKWQYTYNNAYNPANPPANPAQIYILEERRYSLVPDPGTPPPDDDDEDCITEPPETDDDCILQLVINRQSFPLPGPQPLRLVNQLSGFQVLIQPSTILGPDSHLNFDDLGTPANPNDDKLLYETDWKQIQAVGVNLTAINPDPSVNVRAANLSLSSQFLPRNALSR